MYKDGSYHGITYTTKFGKEGVFITKCDVQLQRDFGYSPSPIAFYILNLVIEFLAARVERHCQNAKTVAEFLSKHEKVSWVSYSCLEGDKYYNLAQK